MTTDFTHYSDIKVDGKVESSEQGGLIGSLRTMPEATIDNLNLIILYSGLQTSEFTPNRFYQCQSIGSSQYKWIELPIGGMTEVQFKQIAGNATDNASLNNELNNRTEKEVGGTNGKSYVGNDNTGAELKFASGDGLEALVKVNDTNGSDSIPPIELHADRPTSDGTLIGIYNDIGIYVNREERQKGEYLKDKTKYEYAVQKDINKQVKNINFEKVVL